ncbi:MAG: addiction module protein [Nevskiales bacterium]|nr:addiction module protein [Nevskiales bacterium]
MAASPSARPLFAMAVMARLVYCPVMSAINLSEVLKLPVQERIRLVEAIWDSVAEQPDRIELAPWQAEELDRRFAAYQANPSDGIPWIEVKRRILGNA